MLKLGLTMAQIALKAKKLPLAKLKKMFKEHFGIDNAGLSKDQIATKLASAAQLSVKQAKNVASAKGALKGGGFTALGLAPFVFDDEGKSKASPTEVPTKRPSMPKKETKPTPKLTKDDMPKPRPKDLGKKKMFMKERSGKDSKVEFEALKGSIGLNASKKDLKPIPAGKKGKGLSMLSKSVRNNMGFMYGGGMPMPSKKPRMSNTDYRKASKGMLIISIDMKKKKKGKGKKA
jgi:hypothetical protein